MPKDLFEDNEINLNDKRDLLSNNYKNNFLSNSDNTDEFDQYAVEPSVSKNNDNFLTSLGKAPLKIGEDVLNAGLNFAKSIPDYYEKSKTEIPGVFSLLYNHPKNAFLQPLAGLTELGHNTLNLPRGLADYAADRLNLLPKSIAEKIPYQEDISDVINNVFGKPQYPGEELLRGSLRNFTNLVPAKVVASNLNPLRYTNKNIIKNILKEESNQIASHAKDYTQLFNDAKKAGIGSVDFYKSIMNKYLKLIKKYKAEREWKSVKDFINNPTVEKAHQAQSDLGKMKRSLENKSKSSALTGEESKLYDAVKNAQEHIKDNMFKNSEGKVIEPLKNRYNQVTQSYAENVVPYKYNSDIQDYKNKKMLKNELVNKLSKGEFAAKKGQEHPELMRKKLYNRLILGLGGLGAGTTLWDYFKK